MMMEPLWNSTILCVDCEEEMLDVYRDVLTGARISKGNGTGLARHAETESQTPESNGIVEDAAYTVLTASNGEEAVEIVRRELAAGRRIAVGFFAVGGAEGIDVQNAIGRVLQLDDQVLCAVIAAPDGRLPEEIRTLFAEKDGWFYLDKPFSTDELRQTAGHLVSSWNRRRREETMSRNMKTMLDIFAFIDDLSRIPPPPTSDLLEGILGHFLRSLDSANGFLALFPEGHTPMHSVGAGAFNTYSPSSVSELQSRWPVVREAMKGKAPLIAGSLAAVPLIFEQEVSGILLVQKDTDIPEDQTLLGIYAGQAVNMIQHCKLYEELEHRNYEFIEKNVELLDLIGRLNQTEKLKDEFEQLSCIDGLTGVANRRHFENRFMEELALARRQGSSIACLMLDIDHFKLTNDTYGHAAGDYVLTELGRILYTRKRPYDLVARYGGEEFVLVLKQIDSKDVISVSERLRSVVENHAFLFEGRKLGVTVSVGATILTPSAGDTVELVLRKTDEALYAAKKQGRNRCVCA